MKRLTMILAFCALCIGSVSAQDFGVRAGLNIASVGPDNQGLKSKVGFNVGAVVDINLTGSLYLQPGLYISTKGYTAEDDLYTKDKKSTLGYIEMPVLLSYKLDLGSAALRFDAGPYFAFGAFGKIKSTAIYTGEEYSYKNFDKDEGDVKKFDTGLRLGAGAEFGQLYAGLGFEFGFVNLAEDDANITLKNRCFMINLGYNF